MVSISTILLHPDRVIRYINRRILEATTPNDAVKTIRVGPLKGEKWIFGSGVHDFFFGTYEKTIVDTFIQYAKKSNVIYDMGANIGYYTLLASKYVSKPGEVYAFEPLPQNIFYLEKHIELNKISNVRVFECAISNIAGIVEFNELDDAQAGTICKNSTMFNKIRMIKINSITLDDLIENENINPPQLIKMDIEGAEYDALKGGKYLLERHHPTIFLSTHNCHVKGVHKKCCDFLVDLEYNLSYFNLHERLTDMEDPWYEVLAEYKDSKNIDRDVD